MKRLKYLLPIAVLIISASVLFADSVRKIRRDLDKIIDGRQELHNPVITGTLKTPVIQERVDNKGVTFVGDVIITNGLFLPSYTTYDFAHNGVVVISNSTIWFESVEGEHATNTIAGPHQSPNGVHSWCVLINRATNCIWITEGATLDSGGTRELCHGDVMMLIGGTNKWFAIYQDN
jgi:hypothetical protein